MGVRLEQFHSSFSVIGGSQPGERLANSIRENRFRHAAAAAALQRTTTTVVDVVVIVVIVCCCCYLRMFRFYARLGYHQMRFQPFHPHPSPPPPPPRARSLFVTFLWEWKKLLHLSAEAVDANFRISWKKLDTIILLEWLIETSHGIHTNPWLIIFTGFVMYF